MHEPLSSLTHLAGATASLLGLALLLVLAKGDFEKSITLAIYGTSMVILFATSSLYHGARLSDETRQWLNRLDHAAIFLLIAGTYTPIVYHLFPTQWRWLILLIVWLTAAIGIAFKLSSSKIHGLVQASIYPVISWAGVVPALIASRIEPFIPTAGILLLLLGGLVYMIGFIIYYRQRPNPWPGIFGHHEIWHLLVMGGCLCHYIFMVLYVVPVMRS